MKFKRFAKDQATCGIIYARENGEKWLASESALMRIPDGVQSVTGMDCGVHPGDDRRGHLHHSVHRPHHRCPQDVQVYAEPFR